jgi:radical SAM protein with 4Fe4S-binding SPASM domain
MYKDWIVPFNSLKVIRHADKIKQILGGGPLPNPVSVEIDPMTACNHDCVWCMFGHANREKPATLKSETLFRLLDELASIKIQGVLFVGGGEPLCYPEILEAFKQCARLGLAYALVTNAALLDEPTMDELVAHARYVRISLDAGSAETYLKLHRPKSRNPKEFDLVIDNARTLIRKRKEAQSPLTVGIGYLTCRRNAFDIPRSVHLAAALEMDYFQIRPAFFPQELLTDEEITEVNAMFRATQEYYQGHRMVVLGAVHRYDLWAKKERLSDVCRATPLTSVISADANVYLCCQLRGQPEAVIGNVEEQSFADIWQSDRHRQMIQAIDVKKCPPCRYDTYNYIIDQVFIQDALHRDFI